MTGWIKLHRKIVDHWIFKNDAYLKAWLTMLIMVNYEDKKDLIEGELIECKRGQSIYSLNSWCNIFGHGWSIQKIRTFFNLLQKDNMIITEGLRKTTRITICNYEEYQETQQTDNRQTTDRQQTDNRQTTTTKEYKESKEGKENNIIENAIAIELNEWSKNHFHEKYVGNASLDIFDKLLRIDKYTPDEIKQAITWARNDDFWSSNFISPLKLRSKNKEGVKYIDVFLTKIMHNGIGKIRKTGKEIRSNNIESSKDYSETNW